MRKIANLGSRVLKEVKSAFGIKMNSLTFLVLVALRGSKWHTGLKGTIEHDEAQRFFNA